MVTPDPPCHLGRHSGVFRLLCRASSWKLLLILEGTFVSFASDEASQAEVQSTRRYLGRAFWMARLPPEVMRQLLECGGREAVFPAWLLATLGQELPKGGAARCGSWC